MISKFPTYSFKRIAIPRSTTIFLLFGIGLYFGLVFVYTFEILFITGAVYLCTIPISYLHFRKIKNKEKILKRAEDIDETEDVL
jgi:CDP-diacylglycerol--serine O-phosphatidyltransferase